MPERSARAARPRRRAGAAQPASADMEGSPPPEAQAVAEAVERSRERDGPGWKALADCRFLTAYTDGSAPIKNPGGQTGFAAIVLGGSRPFGAPGGERSDGRVDIGGYVAGRKTEPKTSNNRAEIAGVLAALTVVERLGVLREPPVVTIFSDSEYVVRCATGVWKRQKNVDLWTVYDQAVSAILPWVAQPPSLTWVKGHAGNLYNAAADDLATRAALQFDDVVYARYRAAQADNVHGHDIPIPTILQPDPDASRLAARYTLVLLSRVQGAKANGTYVLSDESASPTRGDVPLVSADSPDAAEYQTLAVALVRLIETLRREERDPKEVALQVSSQREVVVRQLNGQYAVKAASLQPLHADVGGLLDRFGQATIVFKSSKQIAAMLSDSA